MSVNKLLRALESSTGPATVTPTRLVGNVGCELRSCGWVESGFEHGPREWQAPAGSGRYGYFWVLYAGEQESKPTGWSLYAWVSAESYERCKPPVVVESTPESYPWALLRAHVLPCPAITWQPALALPTSTEPAGPAPLPVWLL